MRQLLQSKAHAVQPLAGRRTTARKFQLVHDLGFRKLRFDRRQHAFMHRLCRHEPGQDDPVVGVCCAPGVGLNLAQQIGLPVKNAHAINAISKQKRLAGLIFFVGLARQDTVATIKPEFRPPQIGISKRFGDPRPQVPLYRLLDRQRSQPTKDSKRNESPNPT